MSERLERARRYADRIKAIRRIALSPFVADSLIKHEDFVAIGADDLPLGDADFELGFWYNEGDRVVYNGTEYIVLQSHLAQWTPDTTPALFAVKVTQGNAWVAPTGAHDTYLTGAVVTHEGSTWISLVDNNTWEPGVYGWDEV